MTTIRDIAREAGFSVSTVSRVLAGHRDVARDTAEQVQAVIDRHGFSVNRNARRLKQTDSNTIVVVVKGRRNLLFASMLELVQAGVTGLGRSVASLYLDEDDDEVAAAEHLAGEVKPRGVVFLGADAAHFTATTGRIGRDCPAIVLTNSMAGLTDLAVSSVSTDDRLAGSLAVDYLLDQGHRSIGVIGGDPVVSTISRRRLDGVDQALDQAGSRLDRSTGYVATHFSLECGYDGALRLLDRRPGLTAIYAMGDILALGVVRALYDRGLTVPGDVSVVGHDGTTFAAYAVPKLTTVRQPQTELVERAIDRLRANLAGDLEPVHDVLPVELVIGESVRALRG